ncbi:hypothetical protein [Streptomyces sp. NPDC020377]|uniref:hypothetical protein n=1 Tax=Streptomyces sp. NPDC020377 TaxID=3365070 RepID=UPI003795989E
MDYISATFIVKLTDHPTSAPDEVWILSLDGFQMPSEDVIKELLSLTHLPGGDYPVMSHIGSRQGITNWGASSSFVEFILEMSSSGLGGVGTVAVAAAIKSRYAKFRDRSRGDHWGDMISEETALELARMRIAAQYDVDRESLRLSRSETDAASQRFEFTFNHPDGRSFGAEIGILRRAPTCTRIWRQVATG